MRLDVHELFEPAEVAYLRAQELAPQEFRWAYNRAVMAETSGRPFQELMQLLGKAQSMRSDYAALHFRRGRLLAGNGQMDEAIKAHQRALELDPEFAMAQRGWGQALLNKGLAEEAIPVLVQALKNYPKDGPGVAALARARFQTGETEQVDAGSGWASTMPLRDPLRIEVSRMGESATHHRTRAKILLGRGEYGLAIVSLEKALAASPEDAELLRSFAISLLRTRQLPRAEQASRKVVALEPKQAKNHVLLAGVLEAGSKHSEAADEYGIAIDLDTGNLMLLRLQAMALGRGNREQECVLAFEHAASRAKLPAVEQIAWGVAHYQLGDKQAALTHFEAAVLADPKSSAYQGKLGLLLEELERPAEAMEHYREAVRLDPLNPIGRRLQTLEGR
jgi:tetratricopeptide (TPR) repeat protein